MMSERMKVLIIEDLPSDAELAQREISKALGECEFRRVETRPDFLEALETFRPAVIVSDFQLPQFDGLTALKLALERCPDVPFIIATGSMNEDTAVECMKAGAWDYVIKEHIKRLGPAVQGALERQRTGIEARRAEHDREASETRYRRLFEATKDGILILDAETGKIFDVNPFLMELTGYSHKDFLDRHLWEIGPVRDIAASKDSFAKLQAKQYVHYEDLPLQTKDGRKIDVEVVSSVYRVDGQSVIQCNIRDITERRRAVETLAASEARYRSYVDATGQIGWVTDSDGEVVEDLPSWRRFTGQTYEELKGSGWANALHPDDREQTVQAWSSAVATKSAYEVEYRLRRHDGVYRHLLARGSPASRADGSIREWVGTCIDITERKRMEAEREKLEEQFRMSQKMEAIGSLAGGVAHDFNNLLSVILSYTGFAMKGVREGDPLKDDLLEVKNASERAAELTRQLLAFSRKQVLQPAMLDLNQIATGVEKMLRRIIGEDIDFVQVLSPDLGVVKADPGQIEQVLMNLVVNARDAMREGGKVTIETSNVEVDEEYAARHVAVKPGSYVQLAVSDTGCGMDEQTKARIFEPFFTTKEKGKGTGLGLSTVYGIVKQSGGNIWVYSEVGKGTTFKIYLPRDLSATTPTAIKPSALWKRSTGTETILVVEDEEALRKVALRILGASGYKVLTAADGDEALRVSAQHAGDIHLLLTDVVMPQMSGRVLAQELAKARPTVKVLYMSGYTNNAIVHHGVLDAGTHFLPKPFTSADLTRKVREVLDGSPHQPC